MSKNNKQKNKEKKQNDQFVDDGRTIYDMQNVPQAFYNKDKKQPLVDKEEKKALVKAAFATYLPMFLSVVVGFVAVLLLISLWLK